MKIMSKQLFLPWVVFIIFLGCATSQNSPVEPLDVNVLLEDCRYTQKVDNFLILLDVSHSMSFFEYNDRKKIDIAREVVERFNETIPRLALTAGVRIFDPGRLYTHDTAQVYGLTDYKSSELGEALKELFEHPLYLNGDTHLSQTLHSSAEDIQSLKGKTAIIIISDGIVTGEPPMVAIKKLKQLFGDHLCIYPILVGDDPRGICVFEEISGYNDCSFLSQADELLADQHMTEFVTMVFLDKAETPHDTDSDGVCDKRDLCPDDPDKTEPGICGCGHPDIDSDGDGIYDCFDTCPGTPRGAPVDENGCWALTNILFDLNKWFIKEEYFPVLLAIAEVMKNNPSLRMEIQGHTCNIWTEQYNLKLSGWRAESVKIYLLEQGVSQQQLEIKTFGLTRPFASNETEETRKLNRRVQFRPIP
jgi:OOP family OmpA-OmpF porin